MPPPSGAPSWLLGTWRLISADDASGILPGTRMAFQDYGIMRYTISLQGTTHEVELVYSVEGNMLRTEHREMRHASVVRIAAAGDHGMIIDVGGALARFAREDAQP